MLYMRDTRRLALCICLALITVSAVFADGDYVLQPGDVLSVTVMRHPEMSAGNATIAPDGDISLPVVGQIAVAGMTVREVTDEIARRLRARLVRPEVTVSLQRATPAQVFVLGDVRKPGAYALGEGWGVPELLAEAGGSPTPPAMLRATLYRADGERADLDLAAVVAGEGGKLALQAGDILELRPRTISVTVIGAVPRAGTYEVPADAGLLEAIAQAGGLSPGASLGQIVVERASGEQERYDLAPALLHGETPPEVSLQDADAIIVPQERAVVSILGAVAKPGNEVFDASVGMRVTELIAHAGGLTDAPEETSAALLRADGTVMELDLPAILAGDDAAANVQLQPQDIISVTRRTITVQVAGEVKSPGSYELSAGSGVLMALALAEGATGEAAISRVSIRHEDGTAERADLVAAILDGDLGQQVLLRDGDLVMVPVATAQVAVLGAVDKPDYYSLAEGRPTTVSQVIAEAGGLTEDARAGRIGVVRRTPDGPRRITVDLRAVLVRGELDKDLALQNGDIVYVPEASTDWDLVLRAIASVSLMGRWLLD